MGKRWKINIISSVGCSGGPTKSYYKIFEKTRNRWGIFGLSFFR